MSAERHEMKLERSMQISSYLKLIKEFLRSFEAINSGPRVLLPSDQCWVNDWDRLKFAAGYQSFSKEIGTGSRSVQHLQSRTTYSACSRIMVSPISSM